MPLNARPIIETLQRKVNIFISLEFNDREPSVAGQGEDIEHGAIGSGKCRDLRVMMARVKALVECSDITKNQRLEPALGM